jgi:hypothetical protein
MARGSEHQVMGIEMKNHAGKWIMTDESAVRRSIATLHRTTARGSRT